MTDLPSYRAEPDAEFAARLERELLWRLTDPAVALVAEIPLVTEVPETDDDATELDLGVADRHRRLSRFHLAAGGLVAAGIVGVFTLVGNSLDSQPAVAPPAANGLIAFVGQSDDNPATSEIYVVAPDGTGLRALTSTPELVEYAPTWSPDGNRLAFVRTADVFTPSSPTCATGCQLVVVDPSTGVETFAADIPQPEGAVGGAWLPRALAWSPDGRAIVIQSIACGVGGCGSRVYNSSASTPADACPHGRCGGMNSLIAHLETGAFTTFMPPYEAMWSPDGKWLSLLQSAIVPGPSLLLVPADLIGTGGIVDVAELSGVRPLPERPGDFMPGTAEWTPDGSAMIVSDRTSIDVVTVANGERRNLIDDGFDPIVSPDGTQIAYMRQETPGGVKEMWVAAADGSNVRRVTFSGTPPAWSPDGRLLLAGDVTGWWFTVRPDGTDRTALGIHTPFFPLEGVIAGRVDWQPVPAIGG